MVNFSSKAGSSSSASWESTKAHFKKSRLTASTQIRCEYSDLANFKPYFRYEGTHEKLYLLACLCVGNRMYCTPASHTYTQADIVCAMQSTTRMPLQSRKHLCVYARYLYVSVYSLTTQWTVHTFMHTCDANNTMALIVSIGMFRTFRFRSFT